MIMTLAGSVGSLLATILGLRLCLRFRSSLAARDWWLGLGLGWVQGEVNIGHLLGFLHNSGSKTVYMFVCSIWTDIHSLAQA